MSDEAWSGMVLAAIDRGDLYSARSLIDLWIHQKSKEQPQ